jgi:hypothetical protein
MTGVGSSAYGQAKPVLCLHHFQRTLLGCVSRWALPAYHITLNQTCPTCPTTGKWALCFHPTVAVAHIWGWQAAAEFAKRERNVQYKKDLIVQMHQDRDKELPEETMNLAEAQMNAPLMTRAREILQP